MSPLFQFVEGYPFPVPSVTDQGEPIEADGVETFTVEQAAIKSGHHSPNVLREGWRRTFMAIAGEVEDAERGVPELDELRDKVIRTRVCSGLTDDQYAEILMQAKSMGVDLTSGKVWVSTIVEERTGEERAVLCAKLEFLQERVLMSPAFNGYGTYSYRALDGEWKDRWDDPINQPHEIRYTIRRKGHDDPTIVYGLWSEVVRNHSMWRDKPRFMFEKCVEAKALRKAFRDVLGNLYLQEELPDRRGPKGEGPKPVEYAADAVVGYTREAVSTKGECIEAMRTLGVAADPSTLYAKLSAQVEAPGMDEMMDATAYFAAILQLARKLVPRRGRGR
jgi:hypothetical protein